MVSAELSVIIKRKIRCVSGFFSIINSKVIMSSTAIATADNVAIAGTALLTMATNTIQGGGGDNPGTAERVLQAPGKIFECLRHYTGRMLKARPVRSDSPEHRASVVPVRSLVATLIGRGSDKIGFIVPPCSIISESPLVFLNIFCLHLQLPVFIITLC